MFLQTWLDEKGLTHQQFADMCGCTRAAVTRWACHDRTPAPRWMKTIDKVTKGSVKFPHYGFRDAVRNALSKKGHTIASAAATVGIHRNTLSRFLQGDRGLSKEIEMRVRNFAGV